MATRSKALEFASRLEELIIEIEDAGYRLVLDSGDGGHCADIDLMEGSVYRYTVTNLEYRD